MSLPARLSRVCRRSYAAGLAPAADELGVTLPAEPTEDDDAFDETAALLLHDPVPVRRLASEL